ncbi:MAG: hypothetical protein HY255_08005 [Betaproteobacteria bacterium]|nr:hypothetical protein [Betaproteobacteria bacterium]
MEPGSTAGATGKAIAYCGDAYCVPHAAAINADCHDLDYRPGNKILFRLNSGTCWCVCGGSRAMLAGPSLPGRAVKAVGSLLRWAGGGFRRVDAATLEQRYSACLSCEHLSAPPAQPAPGLVGKAHAPQGICTLCGCGAARKASFPHESCPAPHPTEPGINRWGQGRPLGRTIPPAD